MIPGIVASAGRFSGGGGGDPMYPLVGYLMHGEGADGGTTILDSGPNAATITRSGSVVTATAEKLFGLSSIFSSGSSGSYMTLPNASVYRGAGGPWTFEMALRRAPGGPATQVLLDASVGGSNNHTAIYITASNKLGVWTGATATTLGGGGTSIPTNAWVRVRVVWTGTDLLFYYNGALDQALIGVSFPNTWSTTNGVRLLADQMAGAQRLPGHFDEIRFTRGARSTGASYALAPGPFPDSV